MKDRRPRFVIQIMPALLHSPPPRCRSRRAFTLTELLVVIGVVAILMAIILTVLHEAIKAVHALRG